MHLNAVLLPDRTVFVSGGALAREDREVARLQSEIYDPATDTWRIGADRQRGPHVPLRRAAAARRPGRRRRREPPALRQPGRLGAAGRERGDAARGLQPALPVRRAAPDDLGGAPTEWDYGQDIDIASPQAGDVKWLSLIRRGVTTHAFDNSQRLVDLKILGQGGGTCGRSRPTSRPWHRRAGTCSSWWTRPGFRPLRGGCTSPDPDSRLRHDPSRHALCRGPRVAGPRHSSREHGQAAAVRVRTRDSLATAMVTALISAAAAANRATRSSPLPVVVPATRVAAMSGAKPPPRVEDSW